MIKINRKVEYALMVLKHLSEDNSGEVLTAREISKRYKIPFDTTSKVMQTMNAHGILTSNKGVNGGYFLNRPLYEISFLKLSEIIEGKVLDTKCDGKTDCELVKSCNIITPVQKINFQVNNFLKNLNLFDLLYPKNHEQGTLS